MGLIDVLESDVRIVGLDENRHCLQRAKERLWSERQISAEVLARIDISYTDKGYVSNCKPISMDPTASCILVESDICKDPYLIPALRESGLFDAAIVWLMGTHMMRQHSSVVRDKGISNDGQNRLFVQNTAYELADEILKPGGILQVSDRVEMPDDDIGKDDFVQAHRDQASTTTLDVRSDLLSFHPYELPQSGATAMAFTPGTSGRMPKNPKWGILSAISVKA